MQPTRSFPSPSPAAPSSIATCGCEGTRVHPTDPLTEAPLGPVLACPGALQAPHSVPRPVLRASASPSLRAPRPPWPGPTQLSLFLGSPGRPRPSPRAQLTVHTSYTGSLCPDHGHHTWPAGPQEAGLRGVTGVELRTPGCSVLAADAHFDPAVDKSHLKPSGRQERRWQRTSWATLWLRGRVPALVVSLTKRVPRKRLFEQHCPVHAQVMGWCSGRSDQMPGPHQAPPGRTLAFQPQVAGPEAMMPRGLSPQCWHGRA